MWLRSQKARHQAVCAAQSLARSRGAGRLCFKRPKPGIRIRYLFCQRVDADIKGFSFPREAALFQRQFGTLKQISEGVEAIRVCKVFFLIRYSVIGHIRIEDTAVPDGVIPEEAVFAFEEDILRRRIDWIPVLVEVTIIKALPQGGLRGNRNFFRRMDFNVIQRGEERQPRPGCVRRRPQSRPRLWRG